MPHGLQQLAGVHTVAVVEDGQNRFGTRCIAEDIDVRGACGNAVVDQIGNRRLQRVAKVTH